MEKSEKYRNWDLPRRGRKTVPDKPAKSKINDEDAEPISERDLRLLDAPDEEEHAIYLAWKAAQVSANT